MRAAPWSFVALPLLIAFSWSQPAKAQALSEHILNLSQCEQEIISALENCPTCATTPNAFLVRSYQGCKRCLDYTPGAVGSPVFLNDCKAAHPIVVNELADGKHTVVLQAGSLVIGGQIPAVITSTTGAPATPSPAPDSIEYPLVLQHPGGSTPVPSVVRLRALANQHFTLDGDSIILSASMPEPPTDSSPVLVAKAANAAGAIGTPVVLGARNLADHEFWDFIAGDRSGHDPTSGFVNAYSATDLTNALANATPGTVIRIKAGPIVASPSFFISTPGVTIRGDRRGTNIGPEVDGTDSNAFEVRADYVRLTGLHLIGNSSSTEKVNPALAGVSISTLFNCADAQGNVIDCTAANPSPQYYNVYLDHNDMSAWPDEAIAVEDVPYPARSCTQQNSDGTCAYAYYCVTLDRTAPIDTFVIRNFLHHNERKDDGYGVLADSKVMVIGNTFLLNRHAISSGGETHASYTAWFNLVLSDSPNYGGFFGPKYEQDFDIHGTENANGTGYGGIAGSELDMGWNTFLGGGRPNFEVRGYPCARQYFHDNVSEQNFVTGDEDDDDALYSF
jgi:hypothetical protein